MDCPSIAEAVAKATPDVAELLDRHARRCAQMCRNVPSAATKSFRNVPSPAAGTFPNVPSSSDAAVTQTAGMFPNVPESSGMFHDHVGGGDKTNPIPRRGARPLTYRQLAAVRLIVRGRGSLEVARELGVEHHSVARWKRNPAFRAELERLRTLKSAAAAALRPPAAPRPAPPAAAARPAATPSLRMPPMRSLALAPGNPLNLTKEDIEHEAMIEAYLRSHGV